MAFAGAPSTHVRADLDVDIDLSTFSGTVPLYSQRDFRWGGFGVGPLALQNQKDSEGKRVTVARCGCHLTSLSMAFTSMKKAGHPWYAHQQVKFSQGVYSLGWAYDFSPKYLDDFLNTGPNPSDPWIFHGYLEGSGGTKCATQAKPWVLQGQADPGASLFGPFFRFSPTGLTYTKTSWASGQSEVESNLLKGYPTMVHRRTASGGTHANLIVGWDNGKKMFRIYDPMWLANATQSQPQSEIAGKDFPHQTELENYYEYLQSIEAVFLLEPTNTTCTEDGPKCVKWMYVFDDPEPIKLRLTDPRGRRTGYDPVTEETLQEDRDSFFSESVEFADPLGVLPAGDVYRYLAVRDPGPGEYALEVFGIGDGPFVLTLGNANARREEDAATVSGDITLGQVVRYEILRAFDGGLSIQEVSAFAPRARAGQDLSGFLGDDVGFDGRGSYAVDSALSDLSWDFGDGQTATGAEQTHTYGAAGVYTATLTVTTEDGMVASDERTITVIDPASLPVWETLRVSLSSSDQQATNGASLTPQVTPDGRFVVFSSDASDLVPGDTNGRQDVFIKDLTNGDLERVSVASGGAQLTTNSSLPAVSADGRFVSFYSAGAVNVRDRVADSTDVIAVGWHSSISDDGRFVAFDAFGPLLPLDTNGVWDIYVYDRQTSMLECASVDGAGAIAAGGLEGSRNSRISGDGTVVAFQSDATNLPGDGTAFEDVFVRDLAAGVTEIVSLTSSDGQLPFPSAFPTLSADGNLVTFETAFNSVVVGVLDTNLENDVFVRDRSLGTTESISVSSTLGNSGSGSFGSAISPDGRYVAFYSTSNNLVPMGTNTAQYYRRDRQDGSVAKISVDNNDVFSAPTFPLGSSLEKPSLTIAGDVVFYSAATNLVSDDTNDQFDIFMRRVVLPSSAITPVANVAGPYLGWASSEAVPAGVRLDGSLSADPQGRALTAHWDFGDGSPVLEAGLVVTHSYAVAGTYTVTLSVSAGADDSAPVTTEVEVMAGLAPDALSGSGCVAPGAKLTLQGAAVSENATVIAEGWDESTGPIVLVDAVVSTPWGEVTAKTLLPSLTFRKEVDAPADAASGRYSATAFGRQASFNVPCTPRADKLPEADAGGPFYDAEVGVPVVLDGSASADAEGASLSYEWDFGDGTKGKGETVEHVYALAGSYMVSLSVNDGTQSSSREIGTRTYAMVEVVAAGATPAPAPPPRGAVDDDGCGCRVHPRDRERPWLAAGLFVAAVALRGRRGRFDGASCRAAAGQCSWWTSIQTAIQR